jgi:ketosteroid isomerase-like protein
MRRCVPYLLTLCLIALGAGVLNARKAAAEASEVEQVKAANQAYYAALSARDIAAMERVWAQTANAVNVAPPIRPAAHTGWETIKKNYLDFWGTLDELTVSMADPRIEVHGTVAWVYGVEQSQRRAKNGQASGGPNFGTSIFVKEGGRWLMMFHQAALIPPQR